MKKGITLMDGAVGTSLWDKAEARGIKKDPVWRYNIEHPEIVAELAAEMADAGAEIVLANTFGANGPAVKRSSSYTAPEVVSSAMRIAKDALRGRNVKIALSAGPLSALMEPYGDLTEEEAGEIYYEMLSAGVKEGPDLILLQTFIDLSMLRVAAAEAKKFGLPVFCCLSFERRGKTMMGNSVEDMIEELEPLGIDAIGMNCSLGPDLAIPVIKEFGGRNHRHSVQREGLRGRRHAGSRFCGLHRRLLRKRRVLHPRTGRPHGKAVILSRGISRGQN